MAGTASYTAILDANVLYPITLSDTLLTLAEAKLFHARWSETIEEEVIRNLVKNRPDLTDKARKRVTAMRKVSPDCLISNYERFVDGLIMPDPGDRHVLAAAIVGHADAIVTFNLKDFPAELLAGFNIEAIHPDDFIMNQIGLPNNQLEALKAIKEMRERWQKPSFTAESLIHLFESNELVQTAGFLRKAISLI